MAIESILRAIAGGEKNHIGDHWSLTYCSDAADEIERLRARVAELEKDRERLDWLDSDLPQHKERSFHWNREDGDARQAIDAARKEAE